MTRSHFQRLREWLLDEASEYVGDTTLAAAEADARLRRDRLEAPAVDLDTVARIRERWAAAEQARAPRFLRGKFGR